ncbi:MAG: GntR family transcriptional regulator, partial [Actinomycetota bacterium]|nr:GntR family transcriptional regulator [Actinomycetota bacterium]
DVGADVSRADVERSPFYDLLPLRGLELGSVHQTITAELASADAARLLACASGDPLLLCRRVTHDAAGVPTLVSEHRYPADRTTFEIEFSLRTGALQHA